MDGENRLLQFAESLHADVERYVADLQGAETEEDLENEFTHRMMELLADAGVLYDGLVCYHKSTGTKVNGYNFNENDDTLDLFISVYKHVTPPINLPKEEVDTAFRRLTTYFKQCLTGVHKTMRSGAESYDLASFIYESREHISQVRMYLLTDTFVKSEYKSEELLGGLSVKYHIWDIKKTFQAASSGQELEAIEIDWKKRFGCPLMCLHTSAPDAEYDAYVTVIPGHILCEVYEEFGARLLERNVRAFLQVRGKVNKGIRTTILEDPDLFLAYNNGISATAEAVEFLDLGNGARAITKVKDFQIVNGGQTTASLYHASKKDEADLSRVFVQAKLSVVKPDRIAELVPLISRYANSQNKVSEADFSANDKFNVKLQELSRTIWAPAGGTKQQTRWFYERARGQYLDAKNREMTPARKKQFELENPPLQKFTKTDLAKFENTWNLEPHIVSRGSEKNFYEFTMRLRERQTFVPDELYYKCLVAKAIMFRTAEKLVQAQRFGGYRANIVTYSLAYIIERTALRIDLEKIWKNQSVSPALETAIYTVSREVHRALINPPGGKNVTEWCKKPQCWDTVRRLDIELPDELERELIRIDRFAPSRIDRGIDAPDEHEQEVIEKAQGVEASWWFQIAKWAKETNNLQPWQRSLAFSLGQLKTRRREPSRKQAVQALVILEEVQRMGFSPEEN